MTLAANQSTERHVVFSVSKFATFVFGYIQVILGHLLGGDGYQTGVLGSNTHSAFNKGVCVSSYLTGHQHCLSSFHTLF